MRQRAFRFEHIIASSLAAFIARRYSVIRCAKVIGISPVTAETVGECPLVIHGYYIARGPWLFVSSTRLAEVVIISRFQSESAL